MSRRRPVPARRRESRYDGGRPSLHRARNAVPRRILGFLKAHGLRSTWFTPGFTIESHPKICDEVVAADHEIGHHSWAHIPPATQSRAEEEEDLVRANAAIQRL